MNFLLLSGIFVVLFIALPWMFSCSRNRSTNAQNLILITLDTTRADHLGCYGYERARTENLDNFAREGILFENAVCPSPSTVPSHATMMTGLYPPRHGVRVTGRHSLPSRVTTIADILKENGYVTGAVISGYPLTKRFGMNKGFDFYDDSFWEERQGKEMVIERIAEKSVAIAARWLEQNKGSKFFFWLHLYDPHSDYNPPPPFDAEFRDAPYDGEIAYMDWSLGLFFKKLRELNLYDKSLIIIAGDHGEGLGEHGESEHQYLIYNSTIKVPLLIRSGKESGGIRLSGLAGLVDIFPTVMDFLKIGKECKVDGRSLKGMIEKGARKGDGEPYYIESLSAEISLGWSPLYSLMNNQWKFIEAPEPELYQISDDTGEKRNLASQEKQTAEVLGTDLKKLMETIAEPSASAEVSLDEEAVRNLASLGYISSDSSSKKNVGSRKNPKDYIFIERDINALYKLFLTKQYDKVFPHIDKILKADPDNRLALLYAGTAYFETRQNRKALPYLERLYGLYPDIIGNDLLIRIYESENMDEKALQVCDASIDTFPDKAQFHQLKGKILGKNKKFADAIESFRKSLSLDSSNPQTYYFMARCYALMGRDEDAFRSFRSSLEKGISQPEVYLRDPAFRSLKTFGKMQELIASSRGK